MKYYYIDDILVIDIFYNMITDINIKNDILFYDDVDFNKIYRRQRLYIKDNKYYVVQDNNRYKLVFIDNDYEVNIEYFKNSDDFRITEIIRNLDNTYKYIKWYPLNNKKYAMDEYAAIVLCYKTLNSFFEAFNISNKCSLNKFHNNMKVKFKNIIKNNSSLLVN